MTEFIAAVAGLVTIIGAAVAAWRWWRRRPRSSADPMSAEARREHLARLRLAREYMVGHVDLLIAAVVEAQPVRGRRIGHDLERIGAQDPSQIGDMAALRRYVDATSKALAAVPANPLVKFGWFAVASVVPLVDGTRLREARRMIEEAFDRQEGRVLEGLDPLVLAGDDVKAAIDIDAAIARFRKLVPDDPPTS